MQIIWLTDIHLDFVDKNCHIKLIESIVKNAKEYKGQSCVVLTGDLGNSNCTHDFMLEWRKVLELHNNIKLYFVLGNHDYYGSGIERERSKYRDSPLQNNWLSNINHVQLTEETCLVGHDGWYDGGYANWFQSKVDMNDYYQIFELSKNWYEKDRIFEKINELSKEAAEHVYAKSLEAIQDGTKNVFIATHVPPFRENSVYQEQISDDDWMPHFSSKHMGDKIIQLSQENPDIKFVILCGHSHGKAKYLNNNIVCHTGEAQYRYPKICGTFNV